MMANLIIFGTSNTGVFGVAVPYLLHSVTHLYKLYKVVHPFLTILNATTN